MALKKFKATSPGIRHAVLLDRSGLSKEGPHKSLTKKIKSKSGRNNRGVITTRHKSAGVKKLYRKIDFKRYKTDVPATVAAIEYDPNRSCRIALLHYKDGEKAYIIAPVGLNVGDQVISSDTADIKPGNNLPLGKMPVGTIIHNIELRPGKGGQFGRGAGAESVLVAKLGQYCQVKLPSGEARKILSVCRASIGQVGNTDNENVRIGKAGRNRWKGKRPTVRGMAMNPIDHPLGGGEGVGKGHHPVTPWGKPCKGFKTRRNKRTDSMIVRRRAKRKSRK